MLQDGVLVLIQSRCEVRFPETEFNEADDELANRDHVVSTLDCFGVF